MEIQNKHIVLTLDEETLLLSVRIGNMVWKWHDHAVPQLVCDFGSVPFVSARRIRHNTFRNGVGFGIESGSTDAGCGMGENPCTHFPGS